MGRDKLIESVREASAIRDTDDPDAFLYHVCPEPRARRILLRGLRPGMPPTFSNWAGHSRGRVFLTERAGVPFWLQRVEEHLEHDHDDPPTVVVLRVPRDAVEPLLRPDPDGTRDAGAPSWIVSGAVPQRSAPVTGRLQPTRGGPSAAVAPHVLADAARRLRAFLEPVWGWADPDSLADKPCPSARVCVPSAALARAVLEDETGVKWRVAAGCPPGLWAGVSTVGGMLGRDGAWHDHWWASCDALGATVDLTADRLGYSPVIIAPVGDPRYRENTPRRLIELNLRQAEEWPLDWLPLWRASRGKPWEAEHLDALRPCSAVVSPGGRTCF